VEAVRQLVLAVLVALELQVKDTQGGPQVEVQLQATKRLVRVVEVLAQLVVAHRQAQPLMVAMVFLLQLLALP
jgi:signal transduction histidine kinase